MTELLRQQQQLNSKPSSSTWTSESLPQMPNDDTDLSKLRSVQYKEVALNAQDESGTSALRRVP